jgi:peptidyl-prolyl cis-trans isomerase SurA
LKVLDKSELENARRSLQSNGYNDQGIESFEINYRANTPLAFQSEKGVFEYSDHPVLSKVNLDLPFQELEVDGAYYLIILGKKFPSEPRKFEESRGLVIRDYQDYLDKTLMDSLKSKYPIQINAQVKENTFLTLNQ